VLQRISAAFLLAVALGAVVAAPSRAETVHFPSLEDNGPGQPPTVLDGYLFRPADTARHPAVVFLHGAAGWSGAARSTRAKAPGRRSSTAWATSC